MHTRRSPDKWEFRRTRPVVFCAASAAISIWYKLAIGLTNCTNATYPPDVITRTLGPQVHRLARHFPVVTVTGPRQSGKTTLCRTVFPGHRFVTLEAPDVRAFAASDPRGFLEPLSDGAIIDEVQRVPDLLSYLQVEVDAHPRHGRFILTGSANLALMESVGQSLAGRTALLQLLPCELGEVRQFPGAGRDLLSTVWTGGYPAIFDRDVPAGEWLGAYLATYVERDARQLLNIGDLVAFQTFIRMCGGRVGQLLNLSSLGADSGITHNTARAWLSVLETSYLAFRLQPWHVSVSTRLVKSPKLYFHDTGLLCYLLGIRQEQQLREHPLRGAIFENWVVSEVVKRYVHTGVRPEIYFLRDHKGFEVDLLVAGSERWTAVEIKSGKTVAQDYFTALRALPGRLSLPVGVSGLDRAVVYGGDEASVQDDVRVIPWSGVAELGPR